MSCKTNKPTLLSLERTNDRLKELRGKLSEAKGHGRSRKYLRTPLNPLGFFWLFSRTKCFKRRGPHGNQNNRRRNNVPDRIFARRMKMLHSTDNKDAKDSRLKPIEIDFRVEENHKAHHTDEYENKNLIVRRGEEFKITVTFDRPVDVDEHQIILQLATGSRPQQNKKSIIRLQDTTSLSSSSWGMQIVENRGATVQMSVVSPTDAIVGEYSVYLETKTKGPDEKYRSYRLLETKKIYILFNAWCKGDSVFMENDDHRQEYVLNDHGRIWKGSKSYGMPWNFGQFEPVSLETCLKLLDMAEVNPQAQAHPLRICRAISKMVNSNDDDGVLVGNWSGNYSGGTSPGEWTGSVAILKKYSETKKPVKYGQCWVFSGLVTTLLRAIGIPTRSVTNFASAHDNDRSMTIDFHSDEEGNPISTMDDSVWNYHVWNESYFTRPDLPSGYDGWQVHDATPQERSDGVFQCGPCPLKAIKSGEVYIPYDTGFVFAEVNGDMVYWKVDAEGEMSVDVIDKKRVGKFISTKAVGGNDREDLTNMYKFPEGSQEERNAVHLANKYSSRKDEDIYPTESLHDVDFEVRTSKEVMIGENFDIKLAIKNTSAEPRTVKIAIVAKISFYFGVVADDLKDKKEEITIPGKEETTVVLPVMVDEYIKMTPDTSIKTFFKAKVRETGQVFGEIDYMEFTKPELEANIPDQVNQNERFQLTFTFTNPLPVKLKNGKLNLESHGMFPSTLTKSIKKVIKPHAKVSIPVNIEYTRKGTRYLEAVFHSDQLSGIRGEFQIKVVIP